MSELVFSQKSEFFGKDMTTLEICKGAKEVSKLLCSIDNAKIDLALIAMADKLIENTEEILKANLVDLELAKNSVSEVMLDRLRLTKERISDMARGIKQIASLPSPLGLLLEYKTMPNGLKISKVSCPLGVVAIIYESRPNVTSDASALAIKSGNACVLKCGKEAHNSAVAIVNALRLGLKYADIPENAINLLEDTTRVGASELMRARGYVDLLIPRGGAGLIRSCVENATVPCLETGTGICHVYVDKHADLGMALRIIENAKTSRPSVCNACEVCLVHKDIANEFLPLLKETLVDNRKMTEKIPVELICDEAAGTIIEATPASEDSFDTEFLDYKLAVSVVGSISDAISHIEKHSTKHSEAIITADMKRAELFAKNIDSSAVYINASTRFTDGGEFGLGCEMGISTQKLHARGPVGIRELTTYKYIVCGDGQIR